MRQSKECVECGGIYFRPEYSANTQWEARRYCSAVCAGKAGARALHQKALVLGEAILPLDERAAQRKSEPPMVENPPRGVLRELKIIRVGPNPKLLVCEYYELAQRRTCTVLVGPLSKKFVRGMRFKMAEPVAQADFIRPWVYTGPPPRHRGRW